MNRVKKWLLEINIKINYGFQQYNSKKRQNTNFLSDNSVVDITNEYTYLWIKLTPNCNIHNNTTTT